MCLAIPGKVISLDNTKAIADFGGIQRNVDVSLVECKEGDYVLVHVGFAIQTIDEKTAKESYRLLADLDEEAMKEELGQ